MKARVPHDIVMPLWPSRFFSIQLRAALGLVLYSCSPCQVSRKLEPVYEGGRDGSLQLRII